MAEPTKDQIDFAFKLAGVNSQGAYTTGNNRNPNFSDDILALLWQQAEENLYFFAAKLLERMTLLNLNQDWKPINQEGISGGEYQYTGRLDSLIAQRQMIRALYAKGRVA